MSEFTAGLLASSAARLTGFARLLILRKQFALHIKQQLCAESRAPFSLSAETGDECQVDELPPLRHPLPQLVHGQPRA